MDPITATIVAVIMMVIGMITLLLVVTRKAYSRSWDKFNPEIFSSSNTAATSDQAEQLNSTPPQHNQHS
ncbi:hypothetical protein NQ117_18595 [Paenibacillus sp. SC116]|uniref:hypothetical protein n=1 Tax=Paenibacillus sp. SC116 TaxID=2968986 RepID=UPI00215B032D|nr:hypothetical protein [Paenibacillus sp. SC116]MCR8845698.1 hypothetical protein [Paenibacillus sp. SC116]